MFSSQAKREKKKRDAAAKAAEAAKSEAQRDYEKLQASSQQKATEITQDAMRRVAELGWRITCNIVPDQRNPAIAVAQVSLTSTPWHATKLGVAEQKAKQKSEMDAKAAAAEAAARAGTGVGSSQTQKTGDGTAKSS